MPNYSFDGKTMSNLDARVNMIKQQLRTGDVLNESILGLYEQLPRHEFVPAHLSDFAYSDMQIPLSFGQRMLTPLEEGKILQSLALKKHETVLEIGTGTGFFTAMLSKLCKQVISIDYYADFSVHAGKKLSQYECNNVELITGDASNGWMDFAPYDAIVFTGAIEEVSETLKLQVMPGGRLFTIEGEAPVMHACLYHLDHDGVWKKADLFETEIPSLIDKLRTKDFVF